MTIASLTGCWVLYRNSWVVRLKLLKMPNYFCLTKKKNTNNQCMFKLQFLTFECTLNHWKCLTWNLYLWAVFRQKKKWKIFQKFIFGSSSIFITIATNDNLRRTESTSINYWKQNCTLDCTELTHLLAFVFSKTPWIAHFLIFMDNLNITLNKLTFC